MDHQIFLFINSFAGKYPLLDITGIFFAEVAVFVLLLVGGAYSKNRMRFLVQSIITISILASIHYVLGFVFFRERPYQAHEVILLVSQPPIAKSFPSDHAGVAFAMATLLFLSHTSWGYLFYGTAFLVALARVFTGVHYPSDIFVGALIGSIVALGVSTVFNRQKNI